MNLFLAWEVDGNWDHAFGVLIPLASRHANPAHSALRRVRHFEDAERRIKKARWELAAYNIDGEAWLAAADASDAADDARHRQLWSVR